MATERNPYDKIPSAEVIQIPDQGANIEIGETVSFDIEEDGGVVVSFENEFEYEEKTNIKEWFENLAEDMEDFDLVRIAEGVYDRYDADLNSRSEWESMFERGFDLLGLKLEDTSEPFEGACTAVHPLLVESAVKFQSNF